MSHGSEVSVIGGGLAGSEAAWQLAKRGLNVRLFEMRPGKSSSAHTTGALAELVCSNSLGADQPTSAGGILKEELRRLDSLLMRCAHLARVPAGKALAVDRGIFSGLVTSEIEANPNITLIREEVREIPEGAVIIAPGPLISGKLADCISGLVGAEYLHFFDAVAPIVTLSSIDMNLAYIAGRYGGTSDYINCPMDRAQYEAFQRALTAAERTPMHEHEDNTQKSKAKKYFEGCLPVEVMAERGVDVLRFGPMRPVGLPDPATGREPYSVVQLRRDNADGTLYNMVGFQTNLRWSEQERVFRMIPALREADFVRKGVMHENAFVCAPKVLDAFMRPLSDGKPVRDNLFLAGQITGVEGYAESTASGLIAALNMYSLLCGRDMPEWPPETAIGSLLRYLMTAEADSFQPMNVNLGIFPPLNTSGISGKRKKLSKPERCQLFGARSAEAFESILPTII